MYSFLLLGNIFSSMEYVSHTGNAVIFMVLIISTEKVFCFLLKILQVVAKINN